MTEPRLTVDSLTSDALDALYYRLDSARNAAVLHRQGLITTAELYAVIEAGPEPADDLTGYTAPDPPIGCINLNPPAHDAGPSIADCRADDRAWPLQRNGE